MCIYKACPIFDRCEKEHEQVVYCRHVEMIKKIALMRSQLQKHRELAGGAGGAATAPNSEPAPSISATPEPLFSAALLTAANTELPN